MSWLISAALMRDFVNLRSSQEQAEASLPGICSDGEPFAPLNGMPMPQAYSSPDKTMAFSRLSRFGMTCAPLREGHGAAVLMSYRAAFHVMTSASPVAAKGSMESVPASGEKWSGSFAKWSLSGFLPRTPQLSLLEDSEPSWVTWPRSGLMRRGECFLLRTAEHGTSESESGLLPTLTVCGNYNRKGASKTSGDGLHTILATLCARDYKHPGRSRLERTGSKAGDPLPQQVGGPLNPTWCEWFMNFPMGWTSMEAMGDGLFSGWEYGTKSGAKEISDLRGRSVRPMWWQQEPSEAPQGPQPAEQRTRERGDSLRGLPRHRAPQRSASELRDMRDSIPAASEAKEGTGSLWFSAMFNGDGPSLRRTAMGVTSRTDRIRCLGNAQVPIVAAAAFLELASRFE